MVGGGGTFSGNGVVRGERELNKDAKTEALFDERSTIEFMSTPQLED